MLLAAHPHAAMKSTGNTVLVNVAVPEGGYCIQSPGVACDVGRIVRKIETIRKKIADSMVPTMRVYGEGRVTLEMWDGGRKERALLERFKHKALGNACCKHN